MWQPFSQELALEIEINRVDYSKYNKYFNGDIRMIFVVYIGCKYNIIIQDLSCK